MYFPKVKNIFFNLLKNGNSNKKYFLTALFFHLFCSMFPPIKHINFSSYRQKYQIQFYIMQGNRKSFQNMGQNSYSMKNIQGQFHRLSLQSPLGFSSYNEQCQNTYPNLQFQQYRPNINYENLSIDQWKNFITQKQVSNFNCSQSNFYPQQFSINIVQRISMLIQSQLPVLKNMMSYQQIIKKEKKYSKKLCSRSRSREKERSAKKLDSKQTMQWLCRKCSFLNFAWRDRCKTCNELHLDIGSEDWRCTNCISINYSKRIQCHYCNKPK